MSVGESGMQSAIVRNLRLVRESIAAAHKLSGRQDSLPRLVAVSKTKSVGQIVEAYRDGHQRVFGENYPNELIDKANDAELLANCPDLCWHFIGTLQSNKVAKIAGIPRLHMVETVTSEKSAKLLDRHYQPAVNNGRRLAILIQVNTSGEDQKSGVEGVEESIRLADYVELNCPQLEFRGFMTIGSLDASRAELRPNPDFSRLVDVRQAYCDRHGKPIDSVELSMGMSADFPVAVEMGSTNVRVGSTIFGLRS